MQLVTITTAINYKHVSIEIPLLTKDATGVALAKSLF